MRSRILHCCALLWRALFFYPSGFPRTAQKTAIFLLLSAMLLSTALASSACGSHGALRVATTTSLYDTGLWDYLEPMFEGQYGVGLDIIYAGTGKALEWGRRGDVDIVAVHDKAAEEQFVSEGHGVERVPFASNYFVIVGPESDPAGIEGMAPEAAFARIMAEGKANPQQVKFVSRGDNSGTHSREQAIWSAAGYEYDEVRESGGWYIEGGNGMGPILVMADEMEAYTLSDMATFLTFRGDLDLVTLVDKGDVLRNVYSVVVVTKTENRVMANNLVEFLTSEEVQELIGRYGMEEYGRPLFAPYAGGDS